MKSNLPFTVEKTGMQSFFDMVFFKKIHVSLPGFGMKILFFFQKGMGREYVAGIKNGFQISHRNKKVKFHMRNLGRYARIQLELWWNIIYRFMV